MNTEYEVRILEIDKNDFIKRLEQLGAKKEEDFFQRRYVYDFNPAIKGKWIRLRTNGRESTLTIKNIISSLIDGTKEIEIVVSDFDKCKYILNELGYHPKGYQENKRIRYNLDGVEIDIDTWPKLPTYFEVEGKDKKDLENLLNLLGYSFEEAVSCTVDEIYQTIGMDINNMKELRF